MRDAILPYENRLASTRENLKLNANISTIKLKKNPNRLKEILQLPAPILGRKMVKLPFKNLELKYTRPVRMKKKQDIRNYNRFGQLNSKYHATLVSKLAASITALHNTESSTTPAALFNADDIKENDLLTILNPIINSESVWKSHALYLIAEYFYSKEEKQKSKEFFEKIVNLENSNLELKTEAQKRLSRDLSD